MRILLERTFVGVAVVATAALWAWADSIVHPPAGDSEIDTINPLACSGYSTRSSGDYVEVRHFDGWVLMASANCGNNTDLGGGLQYWWSADLQRPGSKWMDGAAYVELYWTAAWQDEVGISFYVPGGGG